MTFEDRITTHTGESLEGSTPALNTRSDAPVWFLDIDGVINSYPSPKPSMLKKYGIYKYKEILGYPIWYSPRVIEFINMVYATGLCEVVWLTTWREAAPLVFAPAVGLNEFPAITDGRGNAYPHMGLWWKWLRVQEFLGDNESKRRVVWTDDDMNREVRKDFRYMYGTSREQNLLITPMSNPGLTPSALDEILNFLKSANPGPPGHSF